MERLSVLPVAKIPQHTIVDDVETILCHFQIPDLKQDLLQQHMQFVIVATDRYRQAIDVVGEIINQPRNVGVVRVLDQSVIDQLTVERAQQVNARCDVCYWCSEVDVNVSLGHPELVILLPP